MPPARVGLAHPTHLCIPQRFPSFLDFCAFRVRSHRPHRIRKKTFSSYQKEGHAKGISAGERGSQQVSPSQWAASPGPTTAGKRASRGPAWGASLQQLSSSWRNHRIEIGPKRSHVAKPTLASAGLVAPSHRSVAASKPTNGVPGQGAFPISGGSPLQAPVPPLHCWLGGGCNDARCSMSFAGLTTIKFFN